MFCNFQFTALYNRLKDKGFPTQATEGVEV